MDKDIIGIVIQALKLNQSILKVNRHIFNRLSLGRDSLGRAGVGHSDIVEIKERNIYYTMEERGADALAVRPQSVSVKLLIDDAARKAIEIISLENKRERWFNPVIEERHRETMDAKYLFVRLEVMDDDWRPGYIMRGETSRPLRISL